MKAQENITWQAFRRTLEQNPSLDLQFQYAENTWVKPSYHITEIKQAPITSVDCGGVVNRWTEVIVQLMEPEQQQQERAMKVRKAMSIIELVEKSLPLEGDAIVKIEFGNASFATRQLIPAEIIADGENLVVDLRADAVQCKAIERGGSCGPAVKPKIRLKNLAAESASCCTPGSGCC